MKATIRFFLKNLRFTLLNVIGLSVGIAVFILLVLFVRYERSFDSFHPNSERIYRIEHLMKEGDIPEKMVGCPAPLGPELLKVFPEIEEMTRVFVTRKFRRFEAKTSNDIVFHLDPLYVDPAFLNIFSFPLVRSGSNDPLNEPFSIVLTESVSEMIFGLEDPIGKVIENDNNLFTITGIIRDIPANSHIQFNSLCSVSTFQALDPDDDPYSWSDNWLSVYVMLRESSAMGAVDAKLRNILRQLWKESTDNELSLQPLERIHLHSDINGDYAVRGDIRVVILMVIIAITVLVMAGVNYANLAVARSIKYSEYAALRKINGASSVSLVRQAFLESMTITIASAIMGLLFASFALPFFNTLVGREIAVSGLLDPISAFVILASVIVLGLVSAIYPAFVIRRLSPLAILRGKTNYTKEKGVPRAVLMVFQYVISIALLLSTINIIRQVSYLTNIDPGYSDSNLIRVEMPEATWQGFVSFSERIRSYPLIVGITAHDYPVNNSTDWCRVGWDGSGQGEYQPIGVNYVDDNFISIYEMVLTGGGGFNGSSSTISSDNNQVILNEEAIRVLNLKDPVGKKVYYGSDYRGRLEGRQATIVGVVEDFNYQSAHDPIKPFMLRLLNRHQPPRSFSVKCAAGNAKEALSLVRDTFEEVFPGQTFNYHFVRDYYKSMYLQESRLEKVVLIMSGLAIFIACLGVLGLVSYSASLRRREVGIRKTQGATACRILSLFSREFNLLLIFAFVLSIPISQIVLHRWMLSFTYKVSFSVAPFIISLASMFFITTLTIIIGTYRIILQSPAEILRQGA